MTSKGRTNQLFCHIVSWSSFFPSHSLDRCAYNNGTWNKWLFIPGFVHPQKKIPGFVWICVFPLTLNADMLPGFKEGQEKMSKSDPSSAIFMEDDEVYFLMICFSSSNIALLLAMLVTPNDAQIPALPCYRLLILNWDQRKMPLCINGCWRRGASATLLFALVSGDGSMVKDGYDV